MSDLFDIPDSKLSTYDYNDLFRGVNSTDDSSSTGPISNTGCNKQTVSCSTRIIHTVNEVQLKQSSKASNSLDFVLNDTSVDQCVDKLVRSKHTRPIDLGNSEPVTDRPVTDELVTKSVTENPSDKPSDNLVLLSELSLFINKVKNNQISL